MRGTDIGDEGPPLPAPRVLVAEDEALIAMDLEMSLVDLGCAVLGPAATVADALALLLRERPDAALLDLGLPDGFAAPVAEALARAGVPFALLTGRSADELGHPALRDAPRLDKPYGQEDLARVVTRLLGR